MLDPRTLMLPPPSSPTSSSVSSSDLDTESTGSFFHDRSTTLGTLMGVNFPAITFRAPSQPPRDNPLAVPSIGSVGGRSNKSKKSRRTLAELRRRRWWRLCSDGEAKPASLGEFLEVERRFGDGAFFGAELEGVMVAPPDGGGGRGLFADGRVLPPVAAEVGDGSSPAGILCSRFPVSLTGICSGGAG
ncbi:hypothetical protein M5689_022918 [Euphorbia peplus]|nr:hypothetical protein M5689_022918 [Euphorbia peplus]